MSSSLNILRTYATLPNPRKSLPPTTLLTSNPNTIVIFDAFPKAKYHFLVLPRYPFRRQGGDPEDNHSLVKLDQLDDLKSLLTKVGNRDVREQVVNTLADAARDVEEMIRDEMVKTEGFEWKIDIGFHAIPSMKHLHLHVISDDRISPAFKTKRHLNSFRQDLGFFIPIMEVQRWVTQEDWYVKERGLYDAENLLSAPLTCPKCDEPFHSMPKLKKHLENEFAEEKASMLKRIRNTGTQRSSDEELF
ncbi:HIT-like domain-containing protein [Naematelia encephala]|uniref:HIT-like domain-containing protein n=1 Tax=Naematelia encephala TaxID=71784 RepID=A0A1Y2B0Z8_9TREE|nr:HIT-like domain-containing protein [Naematelia encephala]